MININTAAWLNQSVGRECGQQETLSVCELALDDSLLFDREYGHSVVLAALVLAMNLNCVV